MIDDYLARLQNSRAKRWHYNSRQGSYRPISFRFDKRLEGKRTEPAVVISCASKERWLANKNQQMLGGRVPLAKIRQPALQVSRPWHFERHRLLRPGVDELQ